MLEDVASNEDCKKTVVDAETRKKEVFETNCESKIDEADVPQKKQEDVIDEFDAIDNVIENDLKENSADAQAVIVEKEESIPHVDVQVRDDTNIDAITEDVLAIRKAPSLFVVPFCVTKCGDEEDPPDSLIQLRHNYCVLKLQDLRGFTIYHNTMKDESVDFIKNCDEKKC